MKIKENKNNIFTLIELLIVITIISILAGLLLPALKKARDACYKVVCLSNHKQFGQVFHTYTFDFDGWWIWDDKNLPVLNRWSNILITEGYIKAGRSQYDPELHCPALEPPSEYRTKNSDYIINSVGIIGTSIPYNTTGPYGYGLEASGPGKLGCKNSDIPFPSKFIVLTDRWDKTPSKYVNVQVFNGWSWPLFSEIKNRVAKYINPYSHMPGGNYLFADGHAEWIPYQNIRWRLFHLRPEEIPNLRNEASVFWTPW